MGSPFLGKCPYRPSQKSLSPQHVESITENSNRTQLQTSTDHEESSSNGCFYTTAPSAMAQETLRKRGR